MFQLRLHCFIVLLLRSLGSLLVGTDERGVAGEEKNEVMQRMIQASDTSLLSARYGLFSPCVLYLGGFSVIRRAHREQSALRPGPGGYATIAVFS